jgi:hypothetical protein
MTSSRWIPLLGALAACNSGPSGPPPNFAATADADTAIAVVVQVTDAVPRSDGSWVLLAIEEGQLLVLQPDSGVVVPHPGINRDEVPMATNIFGSGDTLHVADAGLRRVTTWLPDGNRIDAFPAADALRGSYPRTRDAAGQWYFEIGPIAGRDGSGNRDSSAVVRADPLLTRFDTIARLSAPDLAQVEREGGLRYEARALSGRDRWGVMRDGTLWIARVNQNFIEWFLPGAAKSVRGRSLPDPIITVIEMDRQIYLRRYPEDVRPTNATVPFALVKPPFERAYAGRDGRVWLFKSAPALDSVRTFQVADSTGWLFSVSVPSRGTALGVTPTHILMAEEFPEGVRLIRYAVPDSAR